MGKASLCGSRIINNMYYSMGRVLSKKKRISNIFHEMKQFRRDIWTIYLHDGCCTLTRCLYLALPPQGRHYGSPPRALTVGWYFGRWGDLSIFTWEKKNRIQNSIEGIWVTDIQVLSWKRVQLSDEYVLQELYRFCVPEMGPHNRKLYCTRWPCWTTPVMCEGNVLTVFVPSGR